MTLHKSIECDTCHTILPGKAAITISLFTHELSVDAEDFMLDFCSNKCLGQWIAKNRILADSIRSAHRE